MGGKEGICFLAKSTFVKRFLIPTMKLLFFNDDKFYNNFILILKQKPDAFVSFPGHG